MTTEQARKKVAELKATFKNVMDFTKTGHFDKISPLHEVHIEYLELTPDDFHDLGDGTFYPKKETTDRMGAAAGISFIETSQSRKEDGAYIGHATPQEVGPDGKMIVWSPAEYEFDPETRAQLEILRNKKKYGEKSRYKTKDDEKILELQYKQVARRRADTGARAAAIISAIGMPTGLKRPFDNGSPLVLIFSRIIVNTKNELVMQRALDTMFGNTAAIYGPNAAQHALSGPDGSMVDVTPEEDPFMDMVNPQEKEREDILIRLEEYLNSSSLPATGVKLITAALSKPDEATTDELKDLLKRAEIACKKAEGEGE